MDTGHLSIFIDVIQKGSFAAVAKERNLAPSTVSRVIAALEETAQTRLFVRTTRKMEPTEAAQRLYNRLEPLLEEMTATFNEMVDIRDDVSGEIKLTSPVSLGVLHLVPLLSEFERLYPDVRINFLMTDSRVDIINEKIDVALRFGQLDDSNFISKKLFRLDYFACASADYVQRRGKPSSPAELAAHNCMSFYIPGFGRQWKFRKRRSKTVIEQAIQGNLRISNALALHRAAQLGHGIALLPQFIVNPELRTGSLVNMFPSFEITATEFESFAWMVFPSRVYLPKRVRLLIDFLEQRLAGREF